MTCRSWLAAAAASSLAMYSAPTCVSTVTWTFGVSALETSTIWLKDAPSGPVEGFQTTRSTFVAGGSRPPAAALPDGAAPSDGATLGGATEPVVGAALSPAGPQAATMTTTATRTAARRPMPSD